MNSSVDNLISLSDSGVGPGLSTSGINFATAPVSIESEIKDDVFGLNLDPVGGSVFGESITTSIHQSSSSQETENVDDIFGFNFHPIGGGSFGENKTKGISENSPPKENMDDIFGFNLHPVGGSAFGKSKTTNGNENMPIEEDGGSGLLVDLTDAVQIPMPQGILLQAECDDTFGIFSMAQQSSQGNGDAGKEDFESGDDEASKLVRSFTSGRKSVTVKTKENENIENEEEMEKKDDSCGSIDSDQPTIVESDGGHSPKLPDSDEDEKGVMEQKLNLTANSNVSNFSGGSDSEILDVDNLSSFSIPDDENDENKFIDDIKRKDMAVSSVTVAIVNEIKLQMLQDEDGDEVENDRSLFGGNSYLSARLREHDLVSEVSRPSFASTTTTSTLSDRISTVSRSSRLSVSSQTGNFFGDRDAPSGSTRINGINDSGISVSATTTCTRSRLSSTNFGSPIRASYPLSNRFFMPTPKAKTPSAAATANREGYNCRDRLSESLLSPSRTRVMLVTGDSLRSPSRAPVRKSISAETLHYEYNSPAIRNKLRHSIKFSTPSASHRSRNSVSFSSQSGFPNLFGDDLPGVTERQQNNIHNGGEPLSPPCDSIYSRACEKSESLMINQLNRLNLDESSNMGAVQPIKATAVIAPTKLSKPATTSSTARTGLLKLPTSIAAGQQAYSRPITASSPTTSTGSGRPASNQITPSRSKAYTGIRSSGYGRPQQNLNDTFGSTQPLKSPNKATTSISANIKPPAIPKSLKTGVPSFGGKLELGMRGGGSTAVRTGVTALKPGGKLPAPSSTTGLRRPVAASTVPSTVTGGNKENKLRPTAAPSSSRFGLRQPHRQ